MRIEKPEIRCHEGILVVRDDLFPGGTKARVLSCLFDEREEYVYASPVQGYGQLALAHASIAHGKRATIVCAARKVRHARTLEAARIGAQILEVRPGYLSVVSARAREFASSRNAKLLPFGMNCPEILKAISELAKSLKVQPMEVWSVAGSGTLSRALQIAWPTAKFFAVRVGSQPDAGKAQVLIAPEKYEQDARIPPPFPSCGNYDAKAWQFIRQHASPGALFWNVA